MADNDTRRVTMNLPADEMARLEKQAKKHRSSTTAAVVRSMKIAGYIDAAQEAGQKVLVMDPDGSTTEVQFV